QPRGPAWHLRRRARPASRGRRTQPEPRRLGSRRLRDGANGCPAGRSRGRVRLGAHRRAGARLAWGILHPVKERLTGAIILVALIVLLVPELLTGPIRTRSAAGVSHPGTLAGHPETPLRSY